MWLEEVPVILVAAHAEMLDRLMAEEALAIGSAVAHAEFVGRSKREPEWLSGQWKAWVREVRQHIKRAPAAKATDRDLASMGIAVKRVKRHE